MEIRYRYDHDDLRALQRLGLPTFLTAEKTLLWSFPAGMLLAVVALLVANFVYAALFNLVIMVVYLWWIIYLLRKNKSASKDLTTDRTVRITDHYLEQSMDGVVHQNAWSRINSVETTNTHWHLMIDRLPLCVIPKRAVPMETRAVVEQRLCELTSLEVVANEPVVPLGAEINAKPLKQAIQFALEKEDYRQMLQESFTLYSIKEGQKQQQAAKPVSAVGCLIYTVVFSVLIVIVGTSSTVPSEFGAGLIAFILSFAVSACIFIIAKRFQGKSLFEESPSLFGRQQLFGMDETGFFVATDTGASSHRWHTVVNIYRGTKGFIGFHDSYGLVHTLPTKAFDDLQQLEDFLFQAAEYVDLCRSEKEESKELAPRIESDNPYQSPSI